MGEMDVAQIEGDLVEFHHANFHIIYIGNKTCSLWKTKYTEYKNF